MCGIAGIHRRTDAPIEKIERLADGLLLGIASRGYDSAGLLAIHDDGHCHLDREMGSARRLVRRRRKIRRDARTVLLHTRFATVGTVTIQNAHPVVSGSTAAVHNGTITNASEIFRVFGLERRFEVDSEVVPALIDREGFDQAKACIDLLDGGAALGIVNEKRPRDLLLARTRSYPLVYGVTRDVVVFASTAQAITDAWRYAFRESFPGKIVHVPDWTLVTVNGEVTTERIRDVKTFETTVTRHPKRSSKGERRWQRKQAARRERDGVKWTYHPSEWEWDGDTLVPTVERNATRFSGPADEFAVMGLMDEGFSLDEARAMVYGDADLDGPYDDVSWDTIEEMKEMEEDDDGWTGNPSPATLALWALEKEED